MTIETSPSRLAEPVVDEQPRRLLLENLGRGRGMTIACRMSGLDRDTAWRLAQAWGWPHDKSAIRARYLAEQVNEVNVEVPEPRAAEPEPPVAEAEPVAVDHPAVARARALTAALRDRDAATVASLAGSWSLLETFEVACLAAITAPEELGRALEVLDLPAGGWSAVTVGVEAARWDAGARDATAHAANVERGRRAQ